LAGALSGVAAQMLTARFCQKDRALPSLHPLKNAPAHDEYTAGFFVLRTPLLPIEEFLRLSPPATETAQPQIAGSDRVHARAHLRQWVERPEVQEALWIASPDLVQSLGPWWDDPESAKGRKLEQTLYRYLARMTARATPFGAFAGCTTGEIAGATSLELGPLAQYRRSTRLDMEYLTNLAAQISASDARSNLHFRCNTTLHLAAGKYHHVRGEWQQTSRVFQLVATEPTPPLDATLTRSASGATAGELASALLAGDPDIAPDEADEFIGRLIESQLLVPELMPPVTGTEPILYMVEQFERAKASAVAPELGSAAEELRSVAAELRALDQGGLGRGPGAYDGIVSAVSRLGGEFRPGRLVQLDLFKPAVVATLDRQLVDDVLAAVQILHSIRDDSSQPIFQQFKEEFFDRYQDREVPLLEALDNEAGIGFENEDNPTAEPILAGIDFRPAEEAPQEQAKQRQLVLERRLEELRARNEIVLALAPGLLAELKVAGALPLPDAFSVMGAYFRGPGNQESFYAHTIFGPSGANLLARFRHADEKLAEHVQAHIHAEEALDSSGAVFAEIAHLPEGRVGNVVCRPVLRQYEIPLLATPGVPAERQIALSDLALSLRDGRIVLRSQRLGVEVLPRLTCAHNYGSRQSLKLYKFLCLLQQQETCGDLFWDWGAAGKAPFLPRVTLGNIVFSLACWRINEETARDLARGRTSVTQWRAANLVPRFAFIAEYDNQLLIDFENPLAVETFLEHIKKQTETVMVEMFPAPEALSVRGPEGTFVHEIILPFVGKRTARNKSAHTPTAPAQATAPAATASPAIPGVPLEPGSEWLFAKLYCSPSHADRLLLEFVQPLVAEIISAGAADTWFFMRYGDPLWHLRLRFHGDPGALRDHVLPALRRRVGPWQRQGIVWRLQFNRYESEVERYGGPLSMSVAENLFQLDSELCLDLLKLTSVDAGRPDLRWQLACCGVDSLLSALGLTLEEKESVTRDMARTREQAFVIDQDYKSEMAQTFRTHRHTVSAVLSEVEQRPEAERGAAVGGPALLPPDALAALAHYSIRLKPIRRQFGDLHQANELTNAIPQLAISFAHMHLNRILRSRHLQQEAVLCDLLSRTYASKLARRGNEPPP
jgi:thiopeptide-type bacteriocin biosynthesis protein